MPSSLATRRANQATADDLAVAVPPTRAICDRNFSFSVKATSDLREDERAQIWRMLEEHMREFYASSSFGWHPQQKQLDIFDRLSRFIIVRDVSDPSNDAGIIAYSIFRFDREYRQDVVYWYELDSANCCHAALTSWVSYELQVSKASRRFGLGRLLVQMLTDIGAQWGMTKIMLTVFKANHTAMLFYKSIGFIIDDVSPDFSEDSEEGAEDEYDYSILSRRIL